MVVPDPLQLGIATEIDGQILSRDGRAQPGLYALGSLLRGGLWECTAMPEIRKAAHSVANRLTDTVLPFGVVGGASSR